MESYLKMMEKNQIKPNFWISEEYFTKGNFKEQTDDGSWFWMEEDKEILFPPVYDPENFIPIAISKAPREYWASFIGGVHETPMNSKAKFLDYNYIYSPANFQYLSGKKWRKFRKNINRFKTENTHGVLRPHYVPMTEEIQERYHEHLTFLFETWLRKKEGEEIHDHEILWKYFWEGKNRAVLLNAMGDIYGMNIWDENYMYVNYRYLICLPLKYLDEYMRFQFYTDPVIYDKKKLVNDGGGLDSVGLMRFKASLNPMEISPIYTVKK